MLIHAGATLERPPGPKYFAGLRFAELTFTSTLPKRGTLQRWRATAPADFRVALVAPRAVRIGRDGAFRFDDALEAQLAWYVDALIACDADAVIPTGAELSTSMRDRDRLRTWLDRLPRREGRHVIWAPGGLWEAELAAPFAEELGVLRAFDPLEDDAPTGPVGYARLPAVGARQRFGEGLLVDVLDRLVEAELDEVFVAIESARSFQEARTLQTLAGTLEDLARELDDEDEDLDEDDEDLDDEGDDDDDLDDEGDDDDDLDDDDA
ncbi:MAG: DUF72 domain-containing protein [Myxococcales bacterium]|nr:DUF72 domain-containing protein [Myxococcales bacterium]